MFYDRGNHYEFLSLAQELAAPGDLRNQVTFDFDFKNVEKQYESYHGINVNLRYMLHDSILIVVDILFVLKSHEGYLI